MKSTTIKLGIIAFALSAIGYMGCKKDSTELQKTTTEVTTEQKVTVAEDSEAIKAKIEDFQKTLTAL